MKITLAKFLFFFILFAANSLMAQTLFWKENQEKAKSIHKDIPAGKSMIVFESKLNLVFESSMEYLDSVRREGNLFYLTISQRTCLITIKVPLLKILTNIPFGQLSENSLPTLKPGEIKYFEVGTENKLILFDNTEREKSAGSSDNQMLYEKEALLILTTDPVDMQLEIGSSVKITEIKNQENRHLVYIKPVDQVIGLKEKKNGATIEINVSGIKVKDVKYYFISLPDYLREKKDLPTTPEDFLALAYSNHETGQDSLALVNFLEYISRSKDKYVEPYMMLHDIMLGQKGKSVTIKFFEDLYNKDKSLFNQFMLSYAKKDFTVIKDLANKFPDFLPAKMYSIKNDYNFYILEEGKIDYDHPGIKYCEFIVAMERILDGVKKIEQTTNSKYFLKKETIQVFFSEKEKNFFEKWGNERRDFFISGIKVYLQRKMSKENIIRMCLTNTEFFACTNDDDAKKFLSNLIDETIKKNNHL